MYDYIASYDPYENLDRFNADLEAKYQFPALLITCSAQGLVIVTTL